MAGDQSASPSAGTSATTSSRNHRSHNRLPDTKLTITAVDDNGAPVQPPKIGSKFVSSCGVIARETIGILHKTFKDIPEAEKELAWEKLKESYDYPPEAEMAIKRQAMQKFNSSWKKWKCTLVNEYVFNRVQPPLDPMVEWPQITSKTWREFTSLKNSPEFVAISEEHKLLQARNEHPHRLGTGGYIGKATKWAEEDEAARRSGTPLPFADLEDGRARNWERARGKHNPDGTVTFPNEADAVVYRQLVSSLSDEYVFTLLCTLLAIFTFDIFHSACSSI